MSQHHAVNSLSAAGEHLTDALGTAEWLEPDDALARLQPDSDSIRIGEPLDQGVPLGYSDDRHVAVVSGTRGGKGAGIIIPNLCYWPGSCICIDPKGENATVTARRRGSGSEYAQGMGQKVYILDPFGEVQLDPTLKARFNPLDVIDINSELAVDDAGRIAAAIIVKEHKNDPFFDDASRNLLKGLILHVLTGAEFDGMRNLITVRRLLTQGDWLGVARLKEAGDPGVPPFSLLWLAMRDNPAFDGIVSGIGEQFNDMTEKTRSSVLETARTSTMFIDGMPMQRLLAASDFNLAALKTDQKGISVYLTLPQRYMETHYRWLRLMVSLAIGEMERIKGPPRCGHRTLFVLDEFAGLKRMEAIENAVAQAAGFGVKFMFVLQNLPQIKREYEDNWETFMSNAGLKLFFQVDDQFTREYVSKLLGEREVRRTTRSSSVSLGGSTSRTKGKNFSRSKGTSTSYTDGDSKSRTYGAWGIFVKSRQKGTSRSRSWSTNDGSSWGTNESVSVSKSFSNTDGWSENVHKRLLLNPDEIGRFLSRTDDPDNPAYPGLLLALIPGTQPLTARRVNYFKCEWLEGLFDPHPDHRPPPTLVELRRLQADRAAKRLLNANKNGFGKFLKQCAWGVAIFFGAIVAIDVVAFGVNAYLKEQAAERQALPPNSGDGGASAPASDLPAIAGDLSGFNADGWPIIANQAVHLYGISGINAASQNALSTHWAKVFGSQLYCYSVVADQYRCLSRPFSQASGEDFAADALNNGFTSLTSDFAAHPYPNFSQDAAADYKAAQTHAKWAARGIWASTNGQP